MVVTIRRNQPWTADGAARTYSEEWVRVKLRRISDTASIMTAEGGQYIAQGQPRNRQTRNISRGMIDGYLWQILGELHRNDPLALIEQEIVLPCWVPCRGLLHGVRDPEVSQRSPLPFSFLVPHSRTEVEGDSRRPGQERSLQALVAMIGREQDSNSDSTLGRGIRGPLMRPYRAVSLLAKSRSWMSDKSTVHPLALATRFNGQLGGATGFEVAV